MKSKLFTHKFFIVLCISVAALLGLSFIARATIVNNRFEQMAVDQKYRLKPSADGQFLIQFQDDENENFYATVGLFQGGYYGLDDAYIPTSYDENTKITAIEKEAFSGFDCLKKVVIPNGICEIKDDAFKDSKNITEIYIAPSVNKIAKTAFDGIDNLTIYAEKGSYAEKFAVENKINYKNYTTEPENPEAKNTDYSKIRNGAYYGEYYNYDVIYDDGKPVCVITNYNPMSTEEKLEIPANIDGLDVISIADDAINYGGAKETVVPDTVKFIADNAFKESYSLEDIYLTKNVSYIGKSAFKDSKDLTIHAPTDSYAHTFATKNKINFKATDD